MYGFGKMILLAIVSVVCLMSQATVAHEPKMEELDDLIENLAGHLENADLVSLFPRGMDMVNQLLEAGEMLTKRNGFETLLPAMLNIFSDKSNTGSSGSLNALKATCKSVLILTLQNVVGEKYFEQFKDLIGPLVDATFTFTEIGMKIFSVLSTGKSNTTDTSNPATTSNTATTSNPTEVNVAPRGIQGVTEYRIADKNKK